MKKKVLLTLCTLTVVALMGCGDSGAAQEQPAVEPAQVTVAPDATQTAQEGGDTSEADNQSEGTQTAYEGEFVNISDVMDEIKAQVELVSPMEMTDEFIMNYYGIDTALLADYKFVMSEEATSAETVIIARVNDSDDSDAVKSGIQMILDDKAAEMQDYLPEQYEIVKTAQVQTSGNYIILVISENADTINGIIKQYIGE